MATAITIIKRAMRLIGVLSDGDTPSASESADSLEALNSMLGMWANERLMINAASLDSVTLTPGKAAYTIGPGGEIDTVRPTDVDPMSYVLWGNVSYPLVVLTAQEYNAICLKKLDGTIPQAIWYLPTFPLGQLTLYGVPSEAMTLKLWSWKPLSSFASLTDEVILPPGYDEALAFNLAVSIAPEFMVEASPTVKQRAVMSKKLLKRTNLEVPVLEPVNSTLPRRQFNIYSGE